MSFNKFLCLSFIIHSLMFTTVSSHLHAKKDLKTQLILNLQKTKSENRLSSFPNKKQTNGAFSKRSLSYTEGLIDFIQSRATYPRSAIHRKQEGTVLISLTLDRTGRVLNFKLLTASKYNSLNSAALKLARNIKQYKPFPNGSLAQQDFTIPVNYLLN